ncbi:CocE/NonD family hydrolase [Selenomonas ruminis]|uniref:CocE/NonD family hydrolase n=1 Tax=Selenomonas ruminis TaxID=2593411 RepID=A0A5D6WEM0_9FIRM|nr:CocE/NonD family hydrolase [Selenomonas sp. mPRGC5]TYZ24884.1 CocE/NonD family hydrolase [Selenomonas sp. mPRGC5]
MYKRKKRKLKAAVCLGSLLAMGALGGVCGAEGNASTVVTMPKVMENGKTIDVYYRKGLSPEAARARGSVFKTESMILKAGTVRMPGAKPLSCDILFEKDVPVTLRDGTVIYTDIFRPVDEAKHPAIMAWSPYGKEIGGQWLDDVPGRSGVPVDAVSGLQKFEGPDPAYWVAHGYVIINPDSRGAYESGGNLNYWGAENANDGKDTIEWAAKQPWSNGKIGMSGNSWLTVSQWFIAGEQPEHLAAIAPWEGFVDHFRETANRGGIANPVFPELIFGTFASRNLIEDQPRMVVTHTLMDDYWQDKIAKLQNIHIPAYVVASYTNPVHTHGTFAGFRQIPSKDKWLRVHNTNEWMDYYQPEPVEELRKFFDHYLGGVDNDWEKTPRVRISVLDPGHEDVVDRVEKDFPLPQTRYEKLYLQADNSLSAKPAAKAASVAYPVSQPFGTSFTMTFDKDTELTGYTKLHAYVEADGSDDMELVVLTEKLDKDGKQIPDKMTGQPIQSMGFLRVSQRALDKKLSTDYDPVLASTKEELLQPGQVVPVDIAIWPMGMKYHKGEKLRLTIAPYQAPDRNTVPPFGKAKVTVPADGYTYDPAKPVAMKTLGGNETEVGAPQDVVAVPPSRNKGKHILHVGGKYASYLQVPVIREK